MTTKGTFAQMIRQVKNNSVEDYVELEDVLHALSDDLGFIEILAKAFPEEELKKLEGAAEELLWPAKKI